MNNYTFNIGLRGCKIHPTDCLGLIYPFKLKGEPRIEEGEWEGIPEATLVFQADHEGDLTDAHKQIESLCSLFSQNSIAYKANGEGTLAYNANFEKRYQFDENQFFN